MVRESYRRSGLKAGAPAIALVANKTQAVSSVTNTNARRIMSPRMLETPPKLGAQTGEAFRLDVEAPRMVYGFAFIGRALGRIDAAHDVIQYNATDDVLGRG